MASITQWATNKFLDIIEASPNPDTAVFDELAQTIADEMSVGVTLADAIRNALVDLENG